MHCFESGQGQVSIPIPPNPSLPFTISYNTGENRDLSNTLILPVVSVFTSAVSYANVVCNTGIVFASGVEAIEFAILATPVAGGFSLSAETTYPFGAPFGGSDRRR